MSEAACYLYIHRHIYTGFYAAWWSLFCNSCVFLFCWNRISGALFWCRSRSFPRLRRLGITVTHCAPQWEERRGVGCGDANLVEHCNLGARNERVSAAPTPTCSAQVHSTPSYLVTLFGGTHNRLLWNDTNIFIYLDVFFKLFSPLSQLGWCDHTEKFLLLQLARQNKDI